MPNPAPRDDERLDAADAEAPIDADTPAPAAKPFTTDLALAIERFRLVAEATSAMREEMLTDKRFRASDQWPANIKADRQKSERPFLTINRLPQFIKQITNQARTNRPSIQVNPVDDDADPETAEIFGGLIKNIETNSHAQVAYDTAVEDQVTMGLGYVRLITEYETGTFRIVARIRRVPDALNVFIDPTTVDVGFGDAAYGFERTFVDFGTFKSEHKHATITDADAFVNILGDKAPQWMTDGAIAVVDYYFVEWVEVELALLSTGVTMEKAKAVESLKGYAAQYQRHAQQSAQRGLAPTMPPPPVIEDTRVELQKVVKFAKITGAEVLEEGTWVGSRIPWFPCIGDEIRLEGTVDYRGLVRDARDQQRVYNFQVTALVETIALAPKAPWVIADEQVAPYKRLWQQANTKNWAYLPYKPITSNGLLVAPPQRQAFEPAIHAITVAVEQADNDMKAVTGMYDASLGERGPEQSGKAILARQRQGEVGSANYMGNLGRMLWALGTELVFIIPKIHDVPSIQRVMGKADDPKKVMVHAGRPKDVPRGPEGQLPKGVSGVFDLAAGRYDISVGSGVSADSKRQEAVEMMTEAIRSNKELMPIIGDLYFGSMDWPMARQIAARLKKALPPGLQDDEDADVDVPPALKAKMQQMQQELQQTQAMLAQAIEEIKTKKLEIEGRKDIALLQARVDVLTAKAELAAKRDMQAKKIAADDQAQRRTQSADAVRDAQARVDTMRGAADDRQHETATAEAARAHQTATAAADREAEEADAALDRELEGLEVLHAASEARTAQTNELDDARAARAHEATQATQAQGAQAEQATQAQDAAGAQAEQAQAAAAKQAIAIAKMKPKPGAAKPAGKKT